jgi:primase-polymerase (primpol)-like protein
MFTAAGGEFDGIGFVFSEDVPRRRRPRPLPKREGLVPDAGAIVLKLDSYAEWSPSGQGVHVLLRGRIPGPRRRKAQVEMYDQARFFAMTGEQVVGTPVTIEERQAELELIYRMVFPPAPAVTVDGAVDAHLHLDERVRRRRCESRRRSGEGRWQDTYGSQSRPTWRSRRCSPSGCRPMPRAWTHSSDAAV